MPPIEDIPLDSGAKPQGAPALYAMPEVPEVRGARPASSVGPIIGIVIIVALLVVGALYFWGAHLNSQGGSEPLPLIPADDAGMTPTATTSTTTGSVATTSTPSQ